MKKTVFFWKVLGWVFAGIAGALFHFLFGWTGKSILAAPFSAVNESTWEHMKILFFPLLLFAVVESRYIGQEYKNYWCAKLVGIVSGVLSIPVLYYTANGVFGSSSALVNVAMFFVAVTISFALEYRLTKSEMLRCKSPKTAVVILVLIAVFFAFWTFLPPQIPLFLDPVTGTYGYYKIR